MSLRARLLVASLTLVVVGLLAADVATYSALRAFLHNRVDAQLDGAHRSVERALFQPDGVLPQSALRQLGEVVPGVYVQVRDAADRVLVTVEGRARDDGVAALPLLPDRLVGGQGEAGVLRSTWPATTGGAGYRVRVERVGNATLVVALPLDDTAATLRRLVGIEVFVTIAVLAATAGLGFWLVRLGLRPLADIEAAAESITAGQPGVRVATTSTESEVGRLGLAFNTMLDTIDLTIDEQRQSEEAARASEDRMRRFVGDASHELRTPVAAVRAYAELYRLGADERPEDLARILARIEAEADRMGVLVEDLLLLTRLDENRPLQRIPVDLGAVAGDAVTAARALEPGRALTLTVEGSVEVVGDPDRLRQVVDNLLANVRAHTAPDAAATVTVRITDDRAELTVADEGPGLPEGGGDRLFERFYRADPSRSRDRGGAGLGLSIVAAIVAAHGGTVEAITREEGGAAFAVHLPLLGGRTSVPGAGTETDVGLAAATAAEPGDGDGVAGGPGADGLDQLGGVGDV